MVEGKKVEQGESARAGIGVWKQSKAVKPVKSIEEEKWQVEEDYDQWTPPSTPVGYEGETGGWNM